MKEQSATRQELEVVARRLLGGADDLTVDAASKMKSVGPAFGILAALTAFLWGRRRGRRRSAFVKVNRRR